MARAFRNKNRAGINGLRVESLETRTLLAADLPAIGVTDVTPGSASLDFEPIREIQATDLLGDLNLDNVVDAKDINVMSAVLRSGDQTNQFDLDSSGHVSKGDLEVLVYDILDTQFGDADLNGVVNYRDLGSWQLNMFQQNAGWTGGDFNGDGLTDVHDFNLWNSNREFGATLNAVSSGDFDGDGGVTGMDIDMLAAAIRSQNQDVQFDIDGSGFVDKGDMDVMVTEVAGTFYGDADLNGVVDNSDFRVWQENVFTGETGWGTGDFNGDGVTDVLDFNVWNSFRGQGDEIQPTNSVLVADFNSDGLTDAQDIDMLHAAISASSQNLMFDLTGDLTVDKSDSVFMVNDVLETRFADANLDGVVDSLDLTRWVINSFHTGTGWASGDFNGDGVTDVSDYNIWNNHRDDGFGGGDVLPANSGDVNADGNVDALDIDAVHSAIRAQSTEPGFDLNGDGNVSKADSEMLVYDLIGTKYGDTNLDGFVDFFDHSMLFQSIFTNDAGWSGGDFNGDGFTDVLDFNLWNTSRDVGFQTIQPTSGEIEGVLSGNDGVSEVDRLKLVDAIFAD